MLPTLIKAASTFKAASNPSPFDKNQAPVIGILTQPLPDSLKSDPRFEGKTDYIMEAYTIFMEAAGARVIPLISTDDTSVTDSKLATVNGVLFPGGSGDYLEISEYIYKWAIKENDSGNYFPIWGTCLGYENLAIFASDSKDVLTEHYVDGQSFTIDFLVKPQTTQMFSQLEDPEYFSEEAMTYNNRDWGLSLDIFTTDKGLADMFTATSTTTDPATGDTVVATMESSRYPFFGTQFHPEKALAMYNTGTIDHTWASVQYNRYFADRFLEFARENSNTCEFETCQGLLIQNFDMFVTNDYHGNVYAF